MTDRGREEQWGSRRGDEPTQQFGYGYPGYSDPAYASQTPYGPPYQAPPPPQPTERLPAYSPYGYDTGQYGPPGHGGEPPRPEDPKPPRWLWIVAAVAVITAVGLVIALVIVNSSKQQTVVAPIPSLPEPSFPAPTTTPRAPSTTSRTPSTPLLPLPTLPTTPSRTAPDTTVEGATDSVVYTVEGDGRAINITYVDTGGVLQTEFNVMLPWSREVALPQPAEGSASVSIINVGRRLTCSITVNGVAVAERSGAGLTICAATG